MDKTLLEKYLFELKRIHEHRTEGVEKEIRKTYKKLLKEMQGYIGSIYTMYAQQDKLDYSMLAQAGLDARFLEEVECRINEISADISKQITVLVEETYTSCYDGMVKAVQDSVGNDTALHESLQSIRPVSPEIVRRAVQNPISGLTLKDTLESRRKDIIYTIKREIGVGLSNGDRYTTMSRRISKCLNGDYQKAVRIVRTESHRVVEAGHMDGAVKLNDTLKNGNSGMQMFATWRTMKDERVRPNVRYKTKKGWKNGKKSKYNHVAMDGVKVLAGELFTLPSGAKAKTPGQSGVAGEDINCRCYISYGLEKKIEKDDGSGISRNF